MLALLALIAVAAGAIEPADAPWPESSIASGAQGALTLPTPALPAPGRATLAAGFDYWRGGNFLLPDATSQRTGGGLSLSVGVLRFVEVYGALSLRSTNLFSSAARRTLVSAGDADLGVKLRLPGEGPLAAALLLEADLPSGVGGFSLKGAGGRGAAILGWSRTGRVPTALSITAGYRIDNSANLYRGPIPTLPAFALALASYDRVEAGASLELPFHNATPVAELSLDAPVARQAPLPVSGHPVRSRLLLGLTRVRSDRVPGVALTAGVQLSLARTGRLDERQLPMQGFAPDAPWTVLAALSWSFELPHLPQRRDLDWHDPGAAAAEPSPRPAQPVAIAARPRAVLRVTVLDAKTALPLAGAWVSLVEGTDVGATTGPEGHARLEAEAGAVTVAVAREGYELVTQPVALVAGEEKKLVVQLQPVAPDATVRGKLLGEDGGPLRAAVLLIPSGMLTLPGVGGTEPQVFEGSYSFQVQHGVYDLSVLAPGYRGTPSTLEVRPGETRTRDLVLRRIAGEPTVRLGPAGVEFSQPVLFEPGAPALAAASLPLLQELAFALLAETRPLIVEARVDPYDPTDAARDGAAAQRLSDARARAVIEELRAKGVKIDLRPSGGGLAHLGQPLLELRLAPPPESRPRASRSNEEVIQDASHRHPAL
jgi:hypothetical protein